MSTINNMTLIQDVKAPDHNSLFFYKDPNENTEMDITGIAWLKPTISRRSGLKISFKPSIITDINYYGLQKYPQGFAFILTSNPVDKTIGEKRSGLGFEGIYNSIAFFFDFITNPDKLDANFPHFSITYNLNGQIKSICDDPNLCNIKIPNFYDSEMDDFIANLKISIELFNGKVKVFFNEKNKKTPDFVRNLPEFGYIMDNDVVQFGVSSSMTLFKGVKIQDLQLMTSNFKICLYFFNFFKIYLFSYFKY